MALEASSEQTGLSPEQVERLVAILTDLEAAHARDQVRLLRCLVPRAPVTPGTVLRLLGRFGSLPMQTRQVALRFLVLAGEYGLLPELHLMRALYSVLFHYLQYETLRPLVAQLLFRITRREDVQPFRVRRLYALQAASPTGDAHLEALLSLYKHYRPEFVVLTRRAPAPRLALTAADRLWQERLQRVASLRGVPHAMPVPGLARGRAGPARRRGVSARVVPRLASAPQTGRGAGGGGLEGVEVEGAAALGAQVLEVAPPAQMGAVLASRLLQHHLAITAGLLPEAEAAALRLGHWLGMVLEDELVWRAEAGVAREARQRELLVSLADLAAFLHELPPTAERFLLEELLPRWDGRAFHLELGFLLRFLRPRTPEELEELLLAPLLRLVRAGRASRAARASLLEGLTGLLRNWLRWVQLGVPSLSARQSAPPRCLFLLHEPAELARVAGEQGRGLRASLTTLMRGVEEIWAAVAAADAGLSVLEAHLLVGFFEAGSGLATRLDLPLAIPPSSWFVYCALLSLDPLLVSRVCGLLALFKSESQRVRELGVAPQEAGLDSRLVNAYILDYCDALWRQRLFGGAEPQPQAGPLGQWLPRALAADLARRFEQAPLATPLSSALSVSYSPAFSTQAWEYLTRMQLQMQKTQPSLAAVQVRPDAIRDAMRTHYIEFLRERGLHGLYEFLYTFIQVLIDRRRRLLEEQQQQQKEGTEGASESQSQPAN